MQSEDNWIGKALAIAAAIAIGLLGVGAMATLGGKHAVEGSQNSMEIEELGRFAIQHHNIQQREKENKGPLSFSRVVKVEEQVVAGTMYHLTLEAKEDGDSVPKLYEAKVWVKPWENFKKLQDFKPAPSSSITPADLGVKREGLGSGWREVPVHDPAVKDAAEHAVINIQQRSNSLAAYMLQEILLAKAEVIDGFAKFDLLLKTKRGVKEEQHKVEMHRNLEGNWMLQSHSTVH